MLKLLNSIIKLHLYL